MVIGVIRILKITIRDALIIFGMAIITLRAFNWKA
tara:strand:- start:198 stop:302 length:105 start_codon:yes stop_codon:yes gene_type:complete